MSRKASEKDLEDILEFMQEGLNAKPIQGNPGVKFQTPLRGNPETNMGAGNQTPSGRVSMDSEPLGNQDLNTIAQGVSFPST